MITADESFDTIKVTKVIKDIYILLKFFIFTMHGHFVLFFSLVGWLQAHARLFQYEICTRNWGHNYRGLANRGIEYGNNHLHYRFHDRRPNPAAATTDRDETEIRRTWFYMKNCMVVFHYIFIHFILSLRIVFPYRSREKIAPRLAFDCDDDTS